MTTGLVTIETETQESAPSSCVHYWLIDPPDGPVSQGVCRKFGKQREFGNIYEADTVKPFGAVWG